MGFYDVKNAKLCNIYEGEGLTHREPLLDEDDFERYLHAVDPLLHPGRDVLWVLCSSAIGSASGASLIRRA